MITLHLTFEASNEAKRLLFQAIKHEAERMDVKAIINAAYLINHIEDGQANYLKQQQEAAQTSFAPEHPRQDQDKQPQGEQELP